MSWETMKTEVKSCWCGKSTITYITKMDDWNRVQNHKKINCLACREQDRVKTEEKNAKEKKRKTLYSKAKDFAVSRYLEQWLGMFSNLNKKEAWQLYTNGTEYPALGTFYKHVKEEGVLPYMERNFKSDFEKILDKMDIQDDEIKVLLHQKNRI